MIKDDLPTFDLPANANSTCEFLGKVLVTPHTVSRFIFFIIKKIPPSMCYDFDNVFIANA